MAPDVDQWLEQWVEANITANTVVEAHAIARACAEAANSAGIANAALVQAADGDLETYLAERQGIAAGLKPGGLEG